MEEDIHCIKAKIITINLNKTQNLDLPPERGFLYIFHAMCEVPASHGPTWPENTLHVPIKQSQHATPEG